MSWKLYTSTCYRKNNLHKNRACDGWSKLNMLCLVSGPDKWKQKPDIPSCGDSDYFWNSLSDTARHRISTARKEKGWGPQLFHQIEPNWPLPYSTVPVPRLRDARPAGWVTCCSICASTMPRAQNWTAKGSTLKEDEILCPSGYIINLWRWSTYTCTCHWANEAV